MLRVSAGLIGAAASTVTYAAAIEPGFRLVVQEYYLSLPGWGDRPPLLICITTDLHAGEPWMPMSRIERIVDAANALTPDLHVVLGDLPAHHAFVSRRIPMPDVTRLLAQLRAPLGSYAILGNHDWWDDPNTVRSSSGPPAIRGLLERAGLPVLANQAIRVPHGPGVWLLGTDSAQAFGLRRPGADNLPAAMTPLQHDDAPAILLAHEPDIFPRVPGRIALTLAGHTHGGQIRMFGRSAVVPSRYRGRYAYGLVEEAGHKMVVSGGLGCSIAPIRLGVPPELTVIRIA